MRVHRILSIIAFLFSFTTIWGQADTLGLPQVLIKGKVRDENGQPVSNVIVVNLRTKTGSFGKSDGSFEVKCYRTDTLSISTLGYYPRKIHFHDSIEKSVYYPTLYLNQRVYAVAQVEIFAPRDLEKIQRDIEALGYNERDYMLSGFNAMKSPITFLYQQFSRTEKSRRAVAYMENEDKKRELLKELFYHYVDYQIIDLNEKEFDDFIDFLNVPDEFMKNSTQYDFLIYVRDRFRDYRNSQRRRSLQEADFQYDKN